MNALVLPALVLSLAVFAPGSAAGNSLDDFVLADIHFEIPQRDLIPGIAVRAACDVTASGEPLAVLANGSARSTLAVAAGPCSIVLVLVGIDVVIPVVNTTPLGTSSFYLPGLSVVTLGIVDLSVDLVTTLNSTSRIEDDIGSVAPRELIWSAWGAQRIQVQGMDGFGSVAASHLRTTFTYRMALALSVYALSTRLYHVDLVEVGSVIGTPSLRTNLSVDLRPHPLVLHAAEDIRHGTATISWSGSVDADVDHLELWLLDGASNVSVRLAPASDRTDVLLRPSTPYRAWIVAVDGAGQGTPSNGIAFESAPQPMDAGVAPGGIAGTEGLAWVLVFLAILAVVLGYVVRTRHGRKGD